ncbi:hypothetical protein [Rhodopseudomonas palustris]|uniref:Uncharacterized protein n=1 Tax=Rhodopseudomonas palustris TaxID=1076 RepID=A0A418V2C2_RHOPL|nr:hypothetical protein [Rhodopseudomonas palustris]RJF70203.1 hypothetical protein D4Q52_18050 [Rhodopseudomonas palustris]
METQLEQSDISNVFGMNHPQQMYVKLGWELNALMRSMSVWKDNEAAPEALFHAFNTAITAWHISDWLWQYQPDARSRIATKFEFVFEETPTGIKRGLERFQDAVVLHCDELRVCREVATGSKHMRKTKTDPNIKAQAVWSKVVDPAGFAKPGDLVMSLRIKNKDKETDAELAFIEVFSFWERLMTELGIFTRDAKLLDKIIKVS